MPAPLVSVVVLAYGPEPLLADCVRSVLSSRASDGSPLALDLVVVDNGSDEDLDVHSREDRIRVLRPGHNTGFAGGCNAGAAASAGKTLVFLNSDAVVQPEAISRLTGELADRSVGLVCGSVRLMDRPEVMNSAGNPVHFLGLGWAGGFGEPATAHAEARDVTAASGAFFAVRRETWEALGGFDPAYFAYHEDAELSLRCWQRGLRVRYRPDAVALHDYEFTRHPTKYYLLERNRLMAVATLYPRSLLLALLPALCAFEVAMLALATVQGWLPAKLKGYTWLLRSGPMLVRRRREVQATSELDSLAFAQLLSPRIEAAVLGRVPGLTTVNTILSAYWRLVLAFLKRSGQGALVPR